MSLLAAFGLAPLANAHGANTRLSAGPLDGEVAEAMREAACAGVDVLALQAAACREIRAATGAEPGFVTAGAAAGLMLAAAACLTFEEGRLGALPALFLRVADAPAAEAGLRARSPAIHVNPARLAEGFLAINPIALAARDVPARAAALRAVATPGESA